MMGISQSAFSQYLNGKMALNTDTTLKFADVLGIKPTDIRADVFNKLQNRINLFNLETKYVPVQQTTSGQKTRKKREVLVTIPIGATSHAYAIEVDNDVHDPVAMEGELLIIDPDIKVKPGDRCAIQLVSESHITLVKVTKITPRQYHVVILDEHHDELKLNKTEVQFAHKITAILSRPLN